MSMKICKDGRIWGQHNSYDKLDYRKKISGSNKSGSNNSNWKGGISINKKHRPQFEYLFSQKNLNGLKKTQFKKGHIPWSKGKRGVRFSNYGFKKGHIPWSKGKSIEFLGEKNGMFGKHHSEETKEKIRMSKEKHNPWKRPTGIEKQIINIIEKNNFPFVYVGNGKLWINHKNPDFISNNDKKIIIEVAYPFFKKQVFSTIENYENKRKESFKDYNVLFLYSNENGKINSEEVISKIKSSFGGEQYS